MSERIEQHRDESENGESHRIDGPAIVRNDGSKFWLRHGKYHRRGGPAITHSNGAKFWYCHGKCHRRGGPARAYSDGVMFWYVNGRFLHAPEQLPEAIHPIMEIFL